MSCKGSLIEKEDLKHLDKSEMLDLGLSIIKIELGHL